MARAKRNSSDLEKAKRRLESLQSIKKDLNFGGELTNNKFEAILDDLEAKLAAYNTRLSELDKMGDDIKMGEKAARAMAESMLMAVGSHYGKTSQEYEMAGGRRRKSSNVMSTASQPSSPAPVPAVAPEMNGYAAQPVSVNNP